MASQQVKRVAELQNPEVRAELNWRIHECERKCFASGRLGSFLQARAYARQQATREQVEGQWCESRTGTVQEMRPGTAVLQEATRVCRMCFSNTCVSREGSAREQEDLEVRGGVGIANPSGSIVSSQGSATSSNSYSSSIAEQDHESPRRLLLRPSSTHGNSSQQTSSSPIKSRHHQALLVANSFHRGNSFSACSSPQPRFALTY
jgi:hypothetical protein